MPPAPKFDYYSALEVEKTATVQEIKDSYRRLALAHHPDKNPENAEAATAAFQKIQLAYETLSDPQRRSEYDAHVASAQTPRQPAGQPWGSDEQEDDFDEYFQFHSRSAHDANQLYREIIREWERKQEQRRAKERADLLAEREARLAEEAAKKKAKDEAKHQEEAAKAKARDEQRFEEEIKQEVRWELLRAYTPEEKVKACLHSEFCTKLQQPKKFKCGVCNAKRGMTAFDCPYCHLLLCQQCVAIFTKKRAAPEKPTPAKPEPVAESDEPGRAPQPEQKAAQDSDQDSVADLVTGFKKHRLEKKGEPRAGDKPAKAENEGNPQPEQNKAQPAKQSQPQPPYILRCYYCDGIGHKSRKCPSKPTKNRTCFNCHQKGHFSRDCPEKKSQSHAQ